MDLSLDQFLALPEDAQRPYLGRSILYASQFGRADLDHFGRLADAARARHRLPGGAQAMAELLRHRMVLNFFVQPSSRTFLSFNTAQAYLGLSRMSVRDPAISSISKGESLIDSVRTFLSYIDLLVIRHADEAAAPLAAWTAARAHRRLTLPDGQAIPLPVVSGGAGSKHHPTQALLDVYTLQSSLAQVGGLDGKTLLLAGDLRRGRTVRSLAQLMRCYRGVTLLFAAPERYRMGRDITDQLDAAGVPWEDVPTLAAGLPHADAVYLTRVQDEWDGPTGAGHARADPDFCFRREHLDQLRAHAPLLHPLPKREEIDPALDDLDDPRIAYWRQERNGMWIRVALLAWIFGVDHLLAGPS